MCTCLSYPGRFSLPQLPHRSLSYRKESQQQVQQANNQHHHSAFILRKKLCICVLPLLSSPMHVSLSITNLILNHRLHPLPLPSHSSGSCSCSCSPALSFLSRNHITSSLLSPAPCGPAPFHLCASPFSTETRPFARFQSVRGHPILSARSPPPLLSTSGESAIAP